MWNRNKITIPKKGNDFLIKFLQVILLYLFYSKSHIHIHTNTLYSTFIYVNVSISIQPSSLTLVITIFFLVIVECFTTTNLHLIKEKQSKTVHSDIRNIQEIDRKRTITENAVINNNNCVSRDSANQRKHN